MRAALWVLANTQGAAFEANNTGRGGSMKPHPKEGKMFRTLVEMFQRLPGWVIPFIPAGGFALVYCLFFIPVLRKEQKRELAERALEELTKLLEEDEEQAKTIVGVLVKKFPFWAAKLASRRSKNRI